MQSPAAAVLSHDDMLMGEILMSLKRDSVIVRQPAAAASGSGAAMRTGSYRSNVDLTVTMPTVEDPAASFGPFSTVSPVASSSYGRAPPSHSPSERSKRYGPVVQLEDLKKCFNMPIATVARKFGICATLLKKICRRHGIQRWPHRQIRSLQKSVDMLRESLSVAKGSNKDYIAKKIAAFEYTLDCIMQDPNTAAKGISAGRLASPATEEIVKRGGRTKSSRKPMMSSSANFRALSDDDEEQDEGEESPSEWPVIEDYKPTMSLKSILC